MTPTAEVSRPLDSNAGAAAPGVPRPQGAFMNAGNKRVACGVCRSKKYKCDGTLPGCAKRLSSQDVSAVPQKQLAPKSDRFSQHQHSHPRRPDFQFYQHHRHTSPSSGTTLELPTVVYQRSSLSPIAASTFDHNCFSNERSVINETSQVLQ
ncbi:hypothetical protein BC829DRAFT_67323 [Chytridium lagenaria]|nr:hypothetical protein BC829DRAFT_67323 [Chytridium lagenaria]